MGIFFLPSKRRHVTNLRLGGASKNLKNHRAAQTQSRDQSLEFRFENWLTSYSDSRRYVSKFVQRINFASIMTIFEAAKIMHFLFDG